MLFSIVIANYNGGAFLDEAISSILAQSCQDFELLIVDGGSNDNSIEIIKKYTDRIAWWISEPDRGQSDAFNKGFNRAQGRLMTWINSDDVMLPDSLAAVKAEHQKHPNRHWFTAKMVSLQPDGTVLSFNHPETPYRFYFKMGVLPVHAPSSFFSKELWKKSGGMDLNLFYSMDTELWWTFYALGELPAFVDHYIYGFRRHDQSKTMASHTLENYQKELDPKWERIRQEGSKRDRKFCCRKENPYFRLGCFLAKIGKCHRWIWALWLTEKHKNKSWNTLCHHSK